MKRQYRKIISVTVIVLVISSGLTVFQSKVLRASGPKQIPYSWVDHTVTYGETVGELAERYGTTVRAIKDDNGLVNANVVMPGTKLSIRVLEESYKK